MNNVIIRTIKIKMLYFWGKFNPMMNLFPNRKKIAELSQQVSDLQKENKELKQNFDDLSMMIDSLQSRFASRGDIQGLAQKHIELMMKVSKNDAETQHRMDQFEVYSKTHPTNS